MNILITGGTGLIGRALSRSLVQDGHAVHILTRRPEITSSLLHPTCVPVLWNGRNTTGWRHLAESDAVINLAGESIAGEYMPGRKFSRVSMLTSILTKPWTDDKKRVIRNSRVNTGSALVEAIQKANKKPSVFVQASAVGYYGPHNTVDLPETSPPGNNFLSEVCQAWEDSTLEIESMGIRRVTIRNGLVLSAKGGILPIMLLPFHLFSGGPIGTGKQVVPWIHIQDQVDAIRFLIDCEEAQGVYNLSAPNAVTNAEFGQIAARVLGRPNWMSTPSLALRIALGEKASLVLEGQRAIPKRLLETGFEFKFNTLEPSLRDLLQR